MLDRRTFLATTGATVAATQCYQPAHAQAQSDGVKPTETAKAIVVGDLEGKSVWAMGVLVTIKADSKMTGGGYSVFEDVVPPGQGPPLHTHTKEDETMYVLEGELDVFLGDKQYKAKAGDFAHMARGVPHRFKNVSDKPARMLLSYSPGGFEQWFLDIGTAVTDPNQRPPEVTQQDIRKAVAVAEKYGVRFGKP